MNIEKLHEWDLGYEQARKLQERLAERVRLCPVPRQFCRVGGADVAFSKKAKKAIAAAVVLSFPELDTLEVSVSTVPVDFPYIPGLLTFREGPAVVEAFRGLEQTPELVLFDGQGIAHPRRMGIGSHLGLWLGVPTIGCAKSRLIGEYEMPGERKGQRSPLTDGGKRIGTVLRTRTSVKPLFVSPGHLMDFDDASRLTLRCCGKFRLPEPTRRAHLAVSKAKRALLEKEEGQ